MSDEASSSSSKSDFEAFKIMSLSNVDLLCQEKQDVTSAKFYASDDPEQLGWTMSLYFGSWEEKYISFIVNCDTQSKVQANFEMSILNKKKLVIYNKHCKDITFDNESNCGWGKPRFIALKKFQKEGYSKYAHDGELHLSCHVKYAGNFGLQAVILSPNDSSLSSSHSCLISTLPSDPSLSYLSDLLSLRSSSLSDSVENATMGRVQSSDSDMTLVGEDLTLVGEDLTLVGEEIPAPNAVLKSRSVYFMAMFESMLKDSPSQEVNEVIKFIYNGVIPENVDQIAEYLSLADQYGLNSLKDACAEALKNSLAIQNVVSILVLSSLHKVTDLKQTCLDYIRCHLREVQSLQSWDILKSHPDLLCQIPPVVSPAAVSPKRKRKRKRIS